VQAAPLVEVCAVAVVADAVGAVVGLGVVEVVLLRVVVVPIPGGRGTFVGRIAFTCSFSGWVG